MHAQPSGSYWGQWAFLGGFLGLMLVGLLSSLELVQKGSAGVYLALAAPLLAILGYAAWLRQRKLLWQLTPDALLRGSPVNLTIELEEIHSLRMGLPPPVGFVRFVGRFNPQALEGALAQRAEVLVIHYGQDEYLAFNPLELEGGEELVGALIAAYGGLSEEPYSAAEAAGLARVSAYTPLRVN